MIDRWTNLVMTFPPDTEPDDLLDLVEGVVVGTPEDGRGVTFIVVVPDEVDPDDYLTYMTTLVAESGMPSLTAELVATSSEE